MKQHILPALRLTATCIFVFMVIYPLFIWGIAQLAPAKGKGETITVNNTITGYKLEGQRFTEDRYFNGRPSAVNYNAAGSGGSNKGTSNPTYLADVQHRIDSFLVHNPGIQKKEIPAELVTASGSGLDPDISVAAANVQVKRIAAVRKINEATIYSLVKKHTKKPLLTILGTERVNVLALNIALDELLQ